MSSDAQKKYHRVLSVIVISTALKCTYLSFICNYSLPSLVLGWLHANHPERDEEGAVDTSIDSCIKNE